MTPILVVLSASLVLMRGFGYQPGPLVRLTLVAPQVVLEGSLDTAHKVHTIGVSLGTHTSVLGRLGAHGVAGVEWSQQHTGEWTKQLWWLDVGLRWPSATVLYRHQYRIRGGTNREHILEATISHPLGHRWVLEERSLLLYDSGHPVGVRWAYGATFGLGYRLGSAP